MVLVIVGACANRPQSGTVALPETYMATPNAGIIYDTNFTYKNFHASGLLVLKRIEEASYHVVLVSKVGPTLMEFKLNDDGLTWIKTFEKLDRKAVENFLRQDFEIILLSFLENPKKIKTRKTEESYTTFKIKNNTKAKINVDNSSGKVVYAENKKPMNLFKTKATFYYSDQEFPESIVVTHNNINLRLELNLLKINHAER